MTHAEILTKAVEPKNCLACGAQLTKQPKQSYKQWFMQKYCSQVCNTTQPRKELTTAKDMTNLHKFWRRRIPQPNACELCRKPVKRLALSNRSQTYLNVITDWWYLCYPCHGRYDGIGYKVWEVRRGK